MGFLSSHKKLGKPPERAQYDDSQLNQGTIPPIYGRGDRSDRRQSTNFPPGGSFEWASGSGAGNQRDESAGGERKLSRISNNTNLTSQYGRQLDNANQIYSPSGGRGTQANKLAQIKDGGLSGQVLARPPSLRTLRDRYNRTLEGSETFQARYADVIYYVQALRTQNSLIEAEWDNKNYQLDQVYTQLLSVVERFHGTEVDNLRREGLTGSRILDFVLRVYVDNSNMVINLSSQISEAKKARHEAERNLAKETFQHSQEIEALNISHSKTLRDQQNRYEDATKSQQHSHEEEVAGLRAKHFQEILGVKTAWTSEANRLKDTISHLQVALLRPVDSFEPLTDGNAENRLEDLRHLVRALARTSMEGVDHDLLGEAFGQTSFIQSEKKQARKYILESILWTVVVDNFFAHPFSAFGDHGNSLSTAWTQLFETDLGQSNSGFNWPTPTQSSENWRHTTSEALREALMKSDSQKHIRQSHETHLVRVADSLTGAIARVSSKPTTSQVEPIVDKASSLALEFSVQRCRLELFTTAPGEIISTSATKMYDILNQSDGGNGCRGTVALAIFPGLRKTGDAKGVSLDTVSVLRPAAVYLKT